MNSLNSLIAEGTVKDLHDTEQAVHFTLLMERHRGKNVREVSVPCHAFGNIQKFMADKDNRVCRIVGHLDNWCGSLIVAVEHIEFKQEVNW